MPEKGEVTSLLRAWRSGDEGAFDALVPLVYQELHQLAVSHMRTEGEGHTLSATVLVHESFLRLVQSNARPDWQDRKHFFVVASRAMRRLLIDHARRKSAAKRDARMGAVDSREPLLAQAAPWNLIDLDRALERLAAEQPRRARMIELRYFGGLSTEEIGEALEVSKATVSRELRVTEAWLASEIRGPAPETSRH